MSDYISREAAKLRVVEALGQGKSPYNAIVMLPAADVREVKRGKWLYDDDMNTGIYAICSCCKESIYQAFEFFYCPLCGAIMEGDDQT